MMFLINTDTPDIIKLNIPLMLRLLEYSSDATDEELHELVEKLVEVTEKTRGGVLTMKHYKHLVPHEK